MLFPNAELKTDLCYWLMQGGANGRVIRRMEEYSWHMFLNSLGSTCSEATAPNVHVKANLAKEEWRRGPC